MNRSKKYNKYRLSKEHCLEERLKRSNKTPLQRIMEQTANLSKAFNNFTLEDLHNDIYGGDNNENRKDW